MDFSFSVIFLAVFLGFSPAVFWFWFFRGRDKKNPEPNKLMILLFLGGMASTIPAALIQRFVQELIPAKFMICLSASCDLNIGSNILFIMFMMFVLVAPTEEFFKWVFIRWISFKSKSFDQIIDGIKYSIAVALGFAALENVLYLVESLSVADFDTVVSTLLTRFFISTLAHILYAGVMGYYIGRAKFDHYHRRKLLWTGLLLAILIHGAFNFMLYTGLGYYSFIMVAIIFFILLQKFRSKELTVVRNVVTSPGSERVSGASKDVGTLIKESKEKPGASEAGDDFTVAEFCPRCLTKNTHKSKFCPECGEKLFISMR
ncbi:PrsW family glutamic-type intramembrane protease [Patescibacteria group bacterium]